MTLHEALSVHPLSDTLAAERLIEHFGQDLHYDQQRGKWFKFQNGIWVPSDDSHATRLAIESARLFYAEADLLPNDFGPKAEASNFGARYLQSAPGINRVLSLVQKMEPVSVSGASWDANPMLLGTSAGVLDLRTQRLRAGSRADRITQTVGVAYDPSAEAPRWEKFIEEIFEGDEALIGYVHRMLGYCLTGLTDEQAWWLALGPGANGKSTLLNAMMDVLGDYGKVMPFATFQEVRNRSGVPDDIAALQGKRLVIANESVDNAKLDAQRLKSLTGGDKVAARHLYGRWFDFQSQCKVVLSSNHQPTTTDDSYGFWRRVRVLPFNRQFTERERDAKLPERLRAEGPGILNWLIWGCEWCRVEGLVAPDAVTAATSGFEKDADPLGDFLFERCERGPELQVAASAAYAVYQDWCRTERMTPLTKKSFGSWMAKQEGIQPGRSKSERGYTGVALKE